MNDFVIIPDASFGIYSEMIKGEDFEGCKKTASEIFAEAKKIHDKMEEIYINNMDFDRLEDFTTVAVQMFFSLPKTSCGKLRCCSIFSFVFDNNNLINFNLSIIYPLFFVYVY